MTELSRFITSLREAGVDASAEEIADTLWLSRYLEPGPSAEAVPIPVAPALPEAEPVRVALPRPLPASPEMLGQRDLARALSALRGDSRTGRAEIDEDATAELHAMTGLLAPVLTASRERRFDLDLILDRGATMAIWEPRLQQFVKAFQQLSVFRAVTVWWLDSDAADGEHRLYGSAAGGVPHRFGELADPTGRRLTLLVSDCLGAAWRGDRMLSALAELGRSVPLTVVQPLPSRMWERCAPATVQVRWRQTRPWAPNTHLRGEPYEPGDYAMTGGPPIPVIALEPRWIVRWAQMINGNRPDMNGVALISRAVESRPRPEPDPHELVRRFQSMASPTARSFADCLAAAPLLLPVVWLIRSTFLTDAAPRHFAELVLAGVLRPRPGDVRYEFPPGVRELLLDQVPVSRIENIVGEVADFLGGGDAGPATAARRLAECGPWYAAFAVRVLDSLGGRYGDIAAELRTPAPGVR